MKKLIAWLHWNVDEHLFAERTSEALREMAVLWIVFALLDKLIADALTAPWLVTHVAVGLAAWSLALYLEMKDERRRR
jgi:hypothetical protein